MSKTTSSKSRTHQKIDRAIMEAYSMPLKSAIEFACVVELMHRYQELT